MIDPWFIRFESISSVLALTITAADIKFLSAGLFGVVLGWNLYFINRYRKDVVLGDLASVVGAIGGAAVLALFGSGTELFAAYGIGLAVGFFAYLVMLFVLVARSKNFDADWFIDGRYTDPKGVVVRPAPGTEPRALEDDPNLQSGRTRH